MNNRQVKLTVIKDICLNLKTYHDRNEVHGFISNDFITNIDGEFILKEPSDELPKYKRTYRSLDAWEGNYTTHSDIFALGCFIFEVIYERKLFHYVNNDDHQKQLIFEFSLCDKMCTLFDNYVDKEERKKLNLMVSFPDNWKDEENSAINFIIYKCLHCDPIKRISIDKVIELLD